MAFSEVHKFLPPTVASLSTLMAMTPMSLFLLRKFEKKIVPWPNMSYVFSLSLSPFHQYPDAAVITDVEREYLLDEEWDEELLHWKKALPHSPPLFQECRDKCKYSPLFPAFCSGSLHPTSLALSPSGPQMEVCYFLN
jgi:hypothetical protein